jgi:hypothetical protein
MTTVKEHSLGFKPPMVRAILSDTKTMTRRLITPRNSYYDGGPVNKARWAELDWASQDIFVDKGPSPMGNPGPYLHVPDKDGDAVHRIYPRYQPGDRLWVRETWKATGMFAGRIPRDTRGCSRFAYAADETQLLRDQPISWRPSIHMPRWASRITLEITGVRVERLQDISESDCIAEGIAHNWTGDLKTGPNGFGGEGWVPDCGWWHYTNSIDGDPAFTPHESYQSLWESINGPGSWALNPWVWVVEFKRI